MKSQLINLGPLSPAGAIGATGGGGNYGAGLVVQAPTLSVTSIFATGTLLGFDSSQPVGSIRTVIVDAGLTLQHNATSFILPTEANIATEAGDTFTAVHFETGNWRVVAYQRASGRALLNNLPQNSKSAAYTTVLSDANKHILHPTADNNPRTFTIDSNANVAYPIGTRITFINQINTVTIAITSDTLTLQPGGTTGSRTLAANNNAIAIKVAATSWIISGTSGLT